MRRGIGLASLAVVVWGLAWAGQAPQQVPILPSQVMKPGAYTLSTVQVPDWANLVVLIIDRSHMHDPAEIIQVRIEYSPSGPQGWQDLVTGATFGGTVLDEEGQPVLTSTIWRELPDAGSETRRVRGRLWVVGLGMQLDAAFEFRE